MEHLLAAIWRLAVQNDMEPAGPSSRTLYPASVDVPDSSSSMSQRSSRSPFVPSRLRGLPPLPPPLFDADFVRRMSRGSTPGSSPRESEALSPRDSDDLEGGMWVHSRSGRVFFGGDSSSSADLSCDATERPPTEASVLGSWLHVGKDGHRASVSGTR